MTFPNGLNLNLWIISISRVLATVGLALFLATPSASSNPSDLCDAAARKAAKKVGVPIDILATISRIETGRSETSDLQPWPWTVNMQGHGVWFDTEVQAQSYVFQHFQKGARSFDIGCFQINYKWHGHQFKSIDEMFDPQSNALYAAIFLKKLRKETGNWDDAVGAYHSRTHKYAEVYLAKFNKIALQFGLSEERPVLTSNDPSFSASVKGLRRQMSRENESPKRNGSLFPLAHKSGNGLALFARGG